MNPDELIFEGCVRPPLTLVLAPGPGARMDPPFMEKNRAGLAGGECLLARFELTYMRARRDYDPRKAPNRETVLLDCWRVVIASLGGSQRLIIGGKSLGGRTASTVKTSLKYEAWYVSATLSSPGRASLEAQLQHLKSMKALTLIVQRGRDRFGGYAQVGKYVPYRKLKWLESMMAIIPSNLGQVQAQQDNTILPL
jgi:predicted alpha/beta-hydrolase family hydrolase